MSKPNAQIAKVRAAVAAVWDTSAEQTIAQVLEDHYKLSIETEADPGSYDIKNNPYWRKVLDCCNDPKVRRVTLIKSTQVGGTILTHGIMMSAAVVDPAPAMYVAPNRDEVKIQRDRLYGNALVSGDPIRALVPEKRTWNMDVLRLGPMNINLAYAGSPQRLRGKPCKRVFLNETDTYAYKGDAGNPHKAATERTKQFFDSIIFEESTPVGDNSHIAGEWEKSNQERWNVECPHCKRWQDLRFFTAKSGKHIGCGGVAGYRDDHGYLLEPAEAKKQAYYVCVNGCKIEAAFKNALVTGGRWLPAGQYLKYDDDGELITHGEAKRDTTHSGFHVWTMMQSKITMGDIAAAYIEHHNDGKLRDFFQNWLGLRFRVGQKVPTWGVIADKFARQYARGVVPDRAWFLTAAADVQEDLCYWLVVGWGPLRTPYIVDWGEIFKSESSADDVTGEGIILASDLSKLPAILLNKSWPVDGVNPRGATSLPSRLSGIDSNYRVFEVHDLVRSVADENRLRCLRGDDALSKSGKNYRRSIVDSNKRTGEKYEGGLVQYQLYKTYYQDNIAEKLNGAPNQPGALHLPGDVLPAGKKMLRQFANVRKDKKGFYTTSDDGLGKDYRDLLGYCEALADMVVDLTIPPGKNRWTEKAWADALRAETQRRGKPKQRANQPRNILER